MAEVYGSDHISGGLYQVLSPVRCAICRRRTSAVITLEEGPVASCAPQSWVLCVTCAAAVQETVEQSPWRSPLRTRVAVGIVASDRSPDAHPKPWNARYWDRMSDTQWNQLVMIWFWLMILLPPLVFLLVTLLTSTQPQ